MLKDLVKIYEAFAYHARKMRVVQLFGDIGGVKEISGFLLVFLLYSSTFLLKRMKTFQYFHVLFMMDDGM